MRWILTLAAILLLGLVAWGLARIPGVMAVDRDVGPSPLPPRSYTQREKSLMNPKEIPLDAELRAVVERFAAADDATRRKMRAAITDDEFDNLIAFALREAVFAARDGKCERIVTGLAATAMIDLERIDFRDSQTTLGPLHYAARRCGIDPVPLLKKAAAMSTKRVRQAIFSFIERPEAHKTLNGLLLEDVGTGWVRRGTNPYDPTCDLTTAAVRVHDLLDADRYRSDVEIARNFSDHWFPGAEDAYLRIRAGAMLHGSDEAEDDQTQSIMVFLAETADAADADALRSTLEVAEKHASLAIARGNLLAVVIGSAFLGDQPTVETNESIARFAEPLAKILEETLSAAPDRASSDRSRSPR